jgi:hypothetical protein
MSTDPIHSGYSSRSRYCVSIKGPGVDHYEYFETYAMAVKFRKFTMGSIQSIADVLKVENTFQATMLTRSWDAEDCRGYGPWITVSEYLDSEMN